MQRYIAFLSGLPAAKKPVDAEIIRRLFTKLGLLNVEPYPMPDTVIFDTAPVGIITPLAAQISRHLRKSLKTENIWTFIRTARELESMISDIPFGADEFDGDGSSLFVILMSDPPDVAARRRLERFRSDTDELRPSGRDIYWLRRDLSGKPLALADVLGGPATVRSIKTITRLINKERAGDGWARVVPTAADSTQSERSRP